MKTSKKIILAAVGLIIVMVIAILAVFPCTFFDHKYDTGEVTKEATCGTTGMKTYTCKRCGETRLENIASTGEHAWSKWEIIEQPTIERTGTKKRTCNVCGEYDSQRMKKSTIPSSEYKDEEIYNVDGKAMYKVYCLDGSIRFSGDFEGSGNFIIKVLDDNQDLEELVCNEIGTYYLRKTVNVGTGWHYIEIICSDGSWDVSWFGTGGN